MADSLILDMYPYNFYKNVTYTFLSYGSLRLRSPEAAILLRLCNTFWKYSFLSVVTCERTFIKNIVVVVLLFYVHGKHRRSCRDGQLT